MSELWDRYQRNDPAIKLTPEQIEKISDMFEWDFIKLVDLSELVATKAVSLSRDLGMKGPDAIHGASALTVKGLSALQRYDRDFDKLKDKIDVEDPQQISDQNSLSFVAAPRPEDFKDEPVSKIETEITKATDEGGPSESGS